MTTRSRLRIKLHQEITGHLTCLWPSHDSASSSSGTSWNRKTSCPSNCDVRHLFTSATGHTFFQIKCLTHDYLQYTVSRKNCTLVTAGRLTVTAPVWSHDKHDHLKKRENIKHDDIKKDLIILFFFFNLESNSLWVSEEPHCFCIWGSETND